VSPYKAQYLHSIFWFQGKPEPEVNWRIARLLYNISKSDGGTDKKQKIEESYALLQEALEIDQENFAVHKWMAIILNEVSCLQGIKAQILESFNVRKHMLVGFMYLFKSH